MYSNKQLKTIKLIEELEERFGKDRWFTQSELPGVTLHTMKALVEKGYLKWQGRNPTFKDGGTTYYQIIPPIERRI